MKDYQPRQTDDDLRNEVLADIADRERVLEMIEETGKRHLWRLTTGQRLPDPETE